MSDEAMNSSSDIHEKQTMPNEIGGGIVTTPRPAAIEVRDVSFTYGSVPVLENVSFEVREHEFVTIVGPNGGGKTTLLKLLLGLLPVQQGQIKLFGKKPAETRKYIGYMPQNVGFDTKFPVTVLDIVLMGRLGRHHWGHYSHEDREAAMAALSLLKIEDRANDQLALLSGGQRQRVFLARALANDPEMLFLDEPTSSVDIEMGAKLFDFMHRLSETRTIIVVSHDIGLVSHYVQRVLCVNRRILIHPTTAVTGDSLREIYGCDMRLILHDHEKSHNPNGTTAQSKQ